MKMKSHDFSSKLGPGAVWVFFLIAIFAAQICLAESRMMEDRITGAERLESVGMNDLGLAPQIGPDVTTNLRGIALNAEETRLYVADYDNSNIKVVNLANDQVATTIKVGEHPYYLAARPHSNEIWATSSNGRIYIINTKMDKVSQSFRGPDAPVSISFDPSGRYAAVGDSNGGVYTFKAATGGRISKCFFGLSTYGVAILGKKMFYATTRDGWVARVGRNCHVDGIYTAQSNGWGLTLTSDSKYVVAATTSTSVIDAEGGEFLGKVDGSISNYFVSSLDGKIVYGTRATTSNGVEKIDPAARTLIGVIGTQYPLWGITLGAKNGYLYATTASSAFVTVIDSKTDAVVKVIVVPEA
jgi:YVTN family beta-propeller protein